ncbi:MAG: Spy/CpxP family protein refolding chaperone [Bacteroidetes bacterium]|nr:Spy/CpxP family protein refolding chaperone [Bacteroidota bacterium]
MTTKLALFTFAGLLIATSLTAQETVQKRVIVKGGPDQMEAMAPGQEHEIIIQRGDGPDMIGFIPDLTPEQEKKIDDIRFKYRKQLKPLKNQMGELRAKMRTVMSADKINKSDAYKLAEEMNAVELKMEKLRIDEKIEISEQLTEKQRLEWTDMPGPGFGPGMAPVMKKMRWMQKEVDTDKP